jgi:DNA-binding transcriptional LysR family regulator
MLNLERIHVFIHVVERNSFSDAARILKISVPSVSKQIVVLERELGIKLLNRTTRRLYLTDLGRIFYEQCKRVMAEVLETEALTSHMQAEPSGLLKIHSSPYFAKAILIPQLPRFLTQFPRIEIDLELGERIPDPKQEKVDLIYGFSASGPLDWIQKKISQTRYVLCASPGYIERYGEPKSAEGLADHRYIAHKMRTPKNLVRFLKNGVEININPVLTCNDTESMVMCAQSGLGIVQLHDYVVSSFLKENQLIEILKKTAGPSVGVFLYYPSLRFLPAHTRAFINYFS